MMYVLDCVIVDVWCMLWYLMVDAVLENVILGVWWMLWVRECYCCCVMMDVVVFDGGWPMCWTMLPMLFMVFWGTLLILDSVCVWESYHWSLMMDVWRMLLLAFDDVYVENYCWYLMVNVTFFDGGCCTYRRVLLLLFDNRSFEHPLFGSWW